MERRVFSRGRGYPIDLVSLKREEVDTLTPVTVASPDVVKAVANTSPFAIRLGDRGDLIFGSRRTGPTP